MPNKRIPKKLKQDAIIEALLEIRFDTKTIPEILVGRLADHEPWREYQQRRLPAYDLPVALRQANPNLRYQPVIELTSEEHHRSIKLGPQVLSFHQLAPYGGWEIFRPALHEAIDGLFKRADALNVRRLGLRYINAVTPNAHNISSVASLDLKLVVDSRDVTTDVNLNFRTELSDTTFSVVRIATRDFVEGPLPENTSALIDVDVFTKDAFKTKEADQVKQWVDIAHEKEKEQFFQLLTHDTIAALEVKAS